MCLWFVFVQERAIHTVKSAWAPRAIPPEPSRTHSIPSGILTASSLLRTFTRMCCVSPCLTEISSHQMVKYNSTRESEYSRIWGLDPGYSALFFPVIPKENDTIGTCSSCGKWVGGLLRGKGGLWPVSVTDTSHSLHTQQKHCPQNLLNR